MYKVMIMISIYYFAITYIFKIFYKIKKLILAHVRITSLKTCN